MDSEDYQIRLYKFGEEQEIVDLLSLIFTEWKARGEKALDHWRWMYQDNPLGPCNVVVAVKDEEIVGVSHDLHFYSKVGDVIEKTVYGTDAAVHPEHRRRGIHTRMQDLRRANREQYGFCYAYSPNKILIEQNTRKLREGDNPSFLLPVDVNRYLLIRDVDLHLEKKQTDHPWLNKQGYKIMKWVSKIKPPSGKSPHNIEISEVSDFDEAEKFWDRIQSRYKFIALKNREYLNWRYLDPRSGDYHIQSAHNGGEYCGYVVASIDHETPGYPQGNILDLLTDGDEFVGEALVRRALSWLEEHHINAVGAYAVKGSMVSRVLGSVGFIDRGDPLYIGYRVPGKRGEIHPDIEQVNENQTHLMYSDFYVK